jgi:hypothetical protein
VVVAVVRAARRAPSSRARGPSGPVFKAGSLIEAELVRNALEAEGIVATLRNEQLFGVLGEIPHPAAWPEVWLSRPSDWDAAQAVVKSYEERRRTVTKGEVVCPKCAELSPANFELCWRCRAPLGSTSDGA